MAACATLAAAIPPPVAAAEPFGDAAALQAERLRGMRPEIARALLRAAPGGEIALALLACPLPAADGRGRVALFVEIDGGSFLAANQARIAPVEVYAYALTQAGTVAAYLAEAFTLEVARHGDAVWNGGLRFVGWLELPPGAYEMRLLVANARSLARGLASVRMEVPAPAERPVLLPPLFSGPPARAPWLAVRGRAGWSPEGGPAYPLVVRGEPFLPAARPVLVGGREAVARLFAHRLAPAPLRGAVELLGEDLTAGPTGGGDGAPKTGPPVVGSTPLAAADRTPGGGELDSVEVRFTPPAAPPGRYGLRVRLETLAGSILSPAIEVLLVDAGPQDRELLWSDLKRLERGSARAPAPDPAAVSRGDPPPPAAASPDRRSGRGVRRLAAQYRRALASSTVAGDGRPTPLLDFELAVLGGSGKEPLDRLRQAELQVAADLARQRPDLVLALVGLHEELFEAYRRRRVFSLVAHSRRLLENLAEVYAQAGGAPDTAADVLAGVGGYMQQMRAPGDTRRLFGRALEHHPDNPAALLGLASSYEKYGEYANAVAQLERLVAARPEIPEARLRLAVNLERIGDRQRSRNVLAALAATGGRDWVSAIACEELARSLLDAGAPDEAASVLEAAVERMPERQALWVLLAHVHDRLGLVERSRQSLERIAGAREGGPRSERMTYDDWANEPLERARLRLRRAAATLRAELGDELAATAAGRP